MTPRVDPPRPVWGLSGPPLFQAAVHTPASCAQCPPSRGIFCLGLLRPLDGGHPAGWGAGLRLGCGMVVTVPRAACCFLGAGSPAPLCLPVEAVALEWQVLSLAAFSCPRGRDCRRQAPSAELHPHAPLQGCGGSSSSYTEDARGCETASVLAVQHPQEDRWPLPQSLVISRTRRLRSWSLTRVTKTKEHWFSELLCCSHQRCHKNVEEGSVSGARSFRGLSPETANSVTLGPGEEEGSSGHGDQGAESSTQQGQNDVPKARPQ